MGLAYHYQAVGLAYYYASATYLGRGGGAQYWVACMPDFLPAMSAIGTNRCAGMSAFAPLLVQ
jgi:hypothetical protein